MTRNLTNYHSHCSLCDGRAPMEDFVREAVAEAGDIPVFCEGRIHTPQQAREAMDAGAFAGVVGTAITHPTSVTGWFCDALK